MAITINGTGTITGISAGGYPDGSVTAADIESSLDLTGKTVTLPSGTGGKILQVVTTTKTDTTSYTSSSGSFSGNIMSVNITPASANSRILVLFNGNFGAGLSQRIYIRLVGTVGTGAATGDEAASRVRVTTASGIYGSTNFIAPMTFHYVHSPSSTSQLTYSMQMGREGNGTVYLNRSEGDGNSGTIQRTASMLTAIEIAS